MPRVLGPKMCVPFGKILRGNVIPNTVTKTLHTDKVFAPDLRSFTIGAYPGYAPLESQIRTIRSFRRDAILVDDLLHSGSRMQCSRPPPPAVPAAHRPGPGGRSSATGAGT